MNYLKHIVVDNFFDNFSLIEHSFKNIPLFTLDNYNRKFNDTQTWPGTRSSSIEYESPFLFNLFIKEFDNKIGDVFKNMNVGVKLHTHLRLGKDEQKDWIHRDSNPYVYSFLVYLSKTNLNSGTYIYSENNEIISDIKFVQNRAVFFDSRYLHSAYGHHGSSIEDGRLTLNAFYEKV
jgi:hypothetical protein